LKSKFFTLLALLMTGSCYGSDAPSSQLSISPSFLYFDYTEFSTTDQELNTETGWLPGLEIGFDYDITPDWSFGVNTSFYLGTVDYDGQTQQGVPHTTDTDTGLFRLGARVGRLVYKDIQLFAGVQLHRWDRDINDNNNISGITETYEWNEYSLGLNTDFIVTSKDLINLEASLLFIRNATIFVDLTRVNLGTTTLDLGDGTGARLALSWIHQYKNDFNLGLGLFFEGWEFGRSNTRQLENGSSIIYVTEPRSETRNIGLKFDIEYMF
jgi:hypothetical protein